MTLRHTRSNRLFLFKSQPFYFICYRPSSAGVYLKRAFRESLGVYKTFRWSLSVHVPMLP